MTEQKWRIKFRVQNYDRMQSHVKDYVWYVRLVPEADLVFAKMQQLVQDLYAGLEKRQKVAFGFQDEDGDICILSSQDVLDGLLRMQKDKRSLRLVLIPNYAVTQDQKNDDNNDEKVGPLVLRNDGKRSISPSSSSSSSISISKQKDAIDDRGNADVKCNRDYRDDRKDRNNGDVGNVDKKEEDKHADTKDEDKHGDKKDDKGSSDSNSGDNCVDSYKVVTGLLDDRQSTWAKIRASPFQESVTQLLAQLTTIRKVANKLTSMVACDLIRNEKLAEGINEGKEVKENIDKLKVGVKDFETSWKAAHALSHDYKRHIDCLAKIDRQIVACCNQLLQECMQKYRQNKEFKLRVLRRKGNSTQWYLDSVTQLARVNSTGDGDNGEHVVQFESDQKWCVYLPFGPLESWRWIPLFNDCEETTRQVLHIQNQGRN